MRVLLAVVVLLAGLPAVGLAADIVTTASEVMECRVFELDTVFARLRLATGGVRVVYTDSIVGIRVDDPARADSLTRLAPNLRIVSAPEPAFVPDRRQGSGGVPRKRTPQGFVQLELLRLDILGAIRMDGRSEFRSFPFVDVRLFAAALGIGRARARLTGAMFTPLSLSALPLEVGYTVFQRPVRYGLFTGMLPDISAEVGLYYINQHWGMLSPSRQVPPYWKAGIRAEADRYGVGFGGELAVYYARSRYLAESDRYVSNANLFVPCANLYVRLVTNLGF